MDYQDIIRPVVNLQIQVAFEKFGLDAELYRSQGSASIYNSVDEQRVYPTAPDKMVRVLIDEIMDGMAVKNSVSFISQFGKFFTVRSNEPLEIYDKVVIVTIEMQKVPFVIKRVYTDLISGSVIYSYVAEVIV